MKNDALQKALREKVENALLDHDAPAWALLDPIMEALGLEDLDAAVERAGRAFVTCMGFGPEYHVDEQDRFIASHVLEAALTATEGTDK